MQNSRKHKLIYSDGKHTSVVVAWDEEMRVGEVERMDHKSFQETYRSDQYIAVILLIVVIAVLAVYKYVKSY